MVLSKFHVCSILSFHSPPPPPQDCPWNRTNVGLTEHRPFPTSEGWTSISPWHKYVLRKVHRWLLLALCHPSSFTLAWYSCCCWWWCFPKVLRVIKSNLWYRHVTQSSGLAKTILQGTVQGGRQRGRQKKWWEDNIKEWTGLEWNIILQKAENREEWRKLIVKSTVVPQQPARLRDR